MSSLQEQPSETACIPFSLSCRPVQQKPDEDFLTAEDLSKYSAWPRDVAGAVMGDLSSFLQMHPSTTGSEKIDGTASFAEPATRMASDSAPTQKQPAGSGLFRAEQQARESRLQDTSDNPFRQHPEVHQPPSKPLPDQQQIHPPLLKESDGKGRPRTGTIREDRALSNLAPVNAANGNACQHSCLSGQGQFSVKTADKDQRQKSTATRGRGGRKSRAKKYSTLSRADHAFYLENFGQELSAEFAYTLNGIQCQLPKEREAWMEAAWNRHTSGEHQHYMQSHLSIAKQLKIWHR
ncbi:hypothetical protein WJX84_001076 [Apatococcus fuscideae]|uniref:Uncharacterized protein n=1 Tax=Apatococcus fuscideae TaxID=2026836 RepID=A0AAW1T3Z2_9CHLO